MILSISGRRFFAAFFSPAIAGTRSFDMPTG